MLNNNNTNHREEETCHQDHQSTRGNSWMQYPVKNPCLVGKPANRQEGHGQCRKNSAQTMFMKARGALDCDDHRRSIGQGVQPRVHSSVILIQISWTQHQRRPLAVGSNYQRDLIRLTGRQQMESLCGWLLFKAKAHLCHLNSVLRLPPLAPRRWRARWWAHACRTPSAVVVCVELCYKAGAWKTLTDRALQERPAQAVWA